MKISGKLQFIKKISGLSQENLAKKFEVSFATLNSWINNRSIPHKKKQDKIDELYKRYTGETIIPDSEMAVKKNMLLRKNKSNKNLVRTMASREDIFNEFVLQLTYNSNSIEGSTLTENDTEAILFRNESIKNRSLIEHLEAKNHQAVIKYLFKQVRAKMKISEKLILKLHSVLMNSIHDDAGMYRRHGVRMVGANVPTANYIKVPELMKNLVSDINRKNNDLLNHVTRIHSRFEQIHPFSDGNGRVGRLIMLIMLLGNNFAPAIIKQENKNLYYRYLRKSQIYKDYSLLEDFICDAIFKGYKIIEG